jgi:cold shock CspA family protein
MLLGTIARIVSDKGFGFITPCGRGKDMFFHSTGVVDEQFDQLRVGQAVSYEIEAPKAAGDRPRAINVKPCDEKLLGRTAEDEEPAKWHPRARRRKPTWRG